MENSKINWELILHRLDTIVENQEHHDTRLSNLEDKLNHINEIAYDVNVIKSWVRCVEESSSPSQLKEIRLWKGKLDDIVTPQQLSEKLKDVENLKTFRTQALMIWVIIQVLMGLAVFWEKN